MKEGQTTQEMPFVVGEEEEERNDKMLQSV
jgi:hypothetical protein